MPQKLIKELIQDLTNEVKANLIEPSTVVSLVTAFIKMIKEITEKNLDTQKKIQQILSEMEDIDYDEDDLNEMKIVVFDAHSMWELTDYVDELSKNAVESLTEIKNLKNSVDTLLSNCCYLQ